MGLEIDFLPVGDGEKGGDAIAVRYGNLFGDRSQQQVIIIDGGTKETGQQLVQHVKTHYQTDHVDTVICSHLHADHASGLTEVLENLKVSKLIMHLPWEHSADIKHMFVDGRITAKGLADRLKKSLESVKDLETIANRKKIPVIEPFTGLSIHDDGNLLVLGPSVEYYQTLLANFTKTPEPKQQYSLPEELRKAVRKIVRWLSETMEMFTETLDDSGETNPENNSSAIILLKVDDYQALFTGDAGIPALTYGVNYAYATGLNLSNLHFLDVPHHGSKRNIGPSLLNYLIPKTAYISAPKQGDPHHPSRKVTNALKRRGSNVFATKGVSICHRREAPNRGWGAASEIPFHSQVED